VHFGFFYFAVLWLKDTAEILPSTRRGDLWSGVAARRGRILLRSAFSMSGVLEGRLLIIGLLQNNPI